MACLLLVLIPAATLAADVPLTSAELRQRAADIVVALKEYRASLETLLAIYEKNLPKAIERRDQRQEFYTRGIVSRRELEEAENAVTTAQQKIDGTRREIAAVDHAIAEATTARTLAGLSPLRKGAFEQTAVLIRFNGAAAWSLKAGTAKLQEFFTARFHHPLPVSAYGQTPLHDRMGFDHRDALDIALHPDSIEGRAVMDYLRAAGIPFIASWGAVSGAASGAHIHVGQPSPRIVSKR
ncbi:MAG TPA: hypothetical protein VGT00_19705 [Methylomirabilota bacterium]|nr:hypothetical protein [Methylomirabilota bacterium]